MKPDPSIRLALTGFAIMLSLATGDFTSEARAATKPDPENLFRQMATMAPDDCSPPHPEASTVDPYQVEEQLFRTVYARVADRLNEPTPAQPSEAEARARSLLRDIEQSSSEINNNWPSEERFHFETLAVPPVVLIRVSYRDQVELALFGSFYADKDAAVDPGTRWREVGLSDLESRASGIDLFPLYRGPSGRPRFLARVWRSGCAGSIGEAYYGYEWDARSGQLAAQIINIEGAQGLDDAASKPVGRLNTTGNHIQLPYCFFSAVDNWDNPTLCAADSFDLSGDDPRFTGRIYNAPDLVAVNNAIHHAQARDYLALRAYCVSDAVARRLVRQIPPNLFPDDLKVSKVGATHEKVVFAEGAVQFDLVKLRGNWLLEGFVISDER